MKILFLISGWKVPSSRFRVLQYVPYLRAARHECLVLAGYPPKYAHLPALGWRLSNALRYVVRAAQRIGLTARRFDVVFVERELFDDDSLVLERWFRRLGRALVLDVDDAIYLKHPAKFRALASSSDRVIVGNNALLAHVKTINARVALVPTSVDFSKYAYEPRRAEGHAGARVIGWTGTASNLPYLRQIVEPLRDLACEHEFELRIISDGSLEQQALDFAGVSVRHIQWSEAIEIEGLRQFDIGIMPLADDAWCRGKCGLKAIQYLAAGIPAVVSPVGAGVEIVEHGKNGFHARSAQEWKHALARLLADTALRSAMGAAGRTIVEQRYSVSANLPKVLAALDAALDHAREKSPVARVSDPGRSGTRRGS